MHNLSMDVIFNIILFAVFISIVFCLRENSNKNRNQVLQASFNALRFPSQSNDKTFLGVELNILKRLEPSSGQQTGPSYVPSKEFGGPVSDIYWYAKAPSGEFYVAIAMVSPVKFSFDVEWMVKALSESSMRGILCSDKKIYSQVFGEPHATYLAKRMGGNDDGKRYM